MGEEVRQEGRGLEVQVGRVGGDGGAVERNGDALFAPLEGVVVWGRSYGEAGGK